MPKKIIIIIQQSLWISEPVAIHAPIWPFVGAFDQLSFYKFRINTGEITFGKNSRPFAEDSFKLPQGIDKIMRRKCRPTCCMLHRSQQLSIGDMTNTKQSGTLKYQLRHLDSWRVKLPWMNHQAITLHLSICRAVSCRFILYLCILKNNSFNRSPRKCTWVPFL